MSGIIAESQRRVGPTGTRTAFERNLLPRFAEWVVERIERWQPDYLVPAETKGVHVLDAVLAYAREEFGALITTPVLYCGALGYLPAEALREASTMIVEDAVRTGASLDRHSKEIEGHGVAEVRAIACVRGGTRSLRRDNLECYLDVGVGLYTQYLWQLNELVVARGLPPEVDHFVFELRLPRRLRPAWHELQALLAGHGTLTVDSLASEDEEIHPMTLHFPRLPGMPEGAGEMTTDGPNKVRFFPDPDGERVFVLPISFPSLTLRSEFGLHGRSSVEEAREILRATLGHRSRVGEALIEKAREVNPVTMFRAISTSREMELIAGVARLLGAAIPEAQLTAEPDVFDRLYGPAVGPEIERLVTAYVRDAQTQVEVHEHALEAGSAAQPKPVYLDTTVAEATRSLGEQLTELYHQQSEGRRGHHRVGLSISQLAECLPDRDPLLASRCVSFGLAMTTLVPFIESTPAPDGSIKVERQYGVSERDRLRKDVPYRDLNMVKREKSEQVVALVCNRLCAGPFKDRSVPLALLTQMVAILRPLILEEQSIELRVVPHEGRLRLVLHGIVDRIPIDRASSRFFKQADDGGLFPTAEFLRLYRNRGLDLDVDRITEDIELLCRSTGELRR